MTVPTFSIADDGVPRPGGGDDFVVCAITFWTPDPRDQVITGWNSLFLVESHLVFFSVFSWVR